MNIRAIISAPFPWLTIVTGRLLGRRYKRDRKGAHLFRLPRTLVITKEGKWFIGVLFVIGLAAINTGNNLLYLVVAMLLSLIIISGIMSESTLRGVRVRRVLPVHVFRHTSLPVRIYIKNEKTLFPSYSFTVRERKLDGVEGDGLYVVKLRNAEEVARVARYRFKKRGEVVLEGFDIQTRFPFGLFLKGKTEYSVEKVIVLPHVRAIRDKTLLSSLFTGTHGQARKGTGTQLYSLTDYTPQDDSRFIHWKSTAKTLKVLKKEFEHEVEKRVVVTFENFSNGDGSRFEEMVDEVASLIAHFTGRGIPVGLKTLDNYIQPGSGSAHLYRVLHTLAFIKPKKGDGVPRIKVTSL